MAEDSFDQFLQVATQVRAERWWAFRSSVSVSVSVSDMRWVRWAEQRGGAEVDINEALRSLHPAVGAGTEQATARVRGILDDMMR